MTGPADDINATRAFPLEPALLRSMPLFAGFVVLGLFVYSMAGSGSKGTRDMLAGIGCIGLGVWGLARAFVSQAKPGPAPLVLTPEGIHYQFTPKKQVQIPWNAIEGVDSISFSRFGISGLGHPFYFRYIDVTAVRVSQRFYAANIHLDSWLQRGPLWDHRFIPDGQVMQVVFDHDVFAVPASDIRAAIETRWRAFSSDPNAKLPARPKRVEEPLRWLPPAIRPLGLALTSVTAQRLALAALVVLLLPAIYYRSYLWAWWSFPDFHELARQHYAVELINKSGMQARMDSGEIRKFGRLEVTNIGRSHCVREIARDEAAGGFFPHYEATAWCTVELTGERGKRMTGLFRVAVQRSFYMAPSANGPDVKREASGWMAATVPAGEVDARLCSLGYCRR